MPQIAKYKTERGAKRYCAELSTRWPNKHFLPTLHPRDFGWAVGVFLNADRRGGVLSFVGKRPRHFSRVELLDEPQKPTPRLAAAGQQDASPIGYEGRGVGFCGSEEKL